VFSVIALATQGKVNVKVSPCQTSLNGDRERLTQVMVNLLTNAIKYSPPQGTVAVSVSEDPAFVVVQVADNGPGVRDENKGLIFDKFAQASVPHKKEGTGLGLAICKLIIERHGGRIGVSDGSAGGSVFWFKIPKEPLAVG
jgi:two-component system OmpR family sensor kinase